MYHAEENIFYLRIVKMAVRSSLDPYGSTLFSFMPNSIFYTNRNYTTYNKNLQTQVFNYVALNIVYKHWVSSNDLRSTCFRKNGISGTEVLHEINFEIPYSRISITKNPVKIRLLESIEYVIFYI